MILNFNYTGTSIQQLTQIDETGEINKSIDINVTTQRAPLKFQI